MILDAETVLKIKSRQKQSSDLMVNQSDFQKWCQQKTFTEDFREYLKINPIKYFVEIDYIILDSSKSIFANCGEYPKLQEFLHYMHCMQIGNGPNGDLLVWEMGTGDIFFGSHEMLFEQDKPFEFSKLQKLRVANSIQQFFDLLFAGHMPFDSYGSKKSD